MDKRILVFGDSITLGVWDRAGGWVDRLRAHIHDKNMADDDYFTLVYNLGISGDGVKEVLKRFESDTMVRHPQDPNTIILAIGSNDAVINHVTGEYYCPEEDFKTSFDKLLQLSKEHAANVLVLGCYPVDETKTNPIPWYKDHSSKNEYLKKYDQFISEACSEAGLDFIDLFDRLPKQEFVDTLDDGIHPNDKGHEMIAEIVIEELEKQNLI